MAGLPAIAGPGRRGRGVRRLPTCPEPCGILMRSRTARNVRSTELSSQIPPTEHRSDGRDERAGRRIDDPYRWMEEDTPRRRAWLRAQHEDAIARLSAVPCREDLRRRLGEL